MSLPSSSSHIKLSSLQEVKVCEELLVNQGIQAFMDLQASWVIKDLKDLVANKELQDHLDLQDFEDL